MFKKKNILGVNFTNAKEDEVLEYILQGLEKDISKYFIVTPNPEILILARGNEQYKKILNSAKLALPDGMGVMIAGKVIGRELKQRIQGVDFVESLCRAVEEKPITVGFLGAGPAVAEQTAECLKKKYPGLKITFAQEEISETRQTHVENDARSGTFQKQSVHRSLSESLSRGKDLKKGKDQTAFSSFSNGLPSSFVSIPKVDILFVAFGSPKQEIWIHENLPKLPVKVAIGVGGAFDLISGKIKRAPLWIQKAGLEWLFRLFNQPWRAKRQIALIKFIYLVLKERFGGMYNRNSL